MSKFIVRLTAGIAIMATGNAANLTILTVTPFGQPIDECKIESFRGAETETGRLDEHKSKFDGMVGRQLPLGAYDASIRCGDTLLQRRITLTHSNQIELFSRSERLLISDHVKPKLAIRMKAAPPAKETWWIRLIGIYNGVEYLEQFTSPTDEARIVEPESGSYIVAIQSTNGYSCAHQIDLMEFTRLWTFNPSACSFELDRFAHLVQESERQNPRQGRWYEEMREERNLLFRSLRDAADKEPK